MQSNLGTPLPTYSKKAAFFVGIVLATYNSNTDFLEKQIESIIGQDFEHWLCLIADDASTDSTIDSIKSLTQVDKRFVCHFYKVNVGSYLNFERGLDFFRQKSEITHIAFADQDDIWRTDKLSSLLWAAETSQASLIHSDLALINSSSEVIYPSVWQYENRKPERITPNLLLLRNTVTGCSMLFSSSLIPEVLPFPKQRHSGDWYHDHWVALVAAHYGHITHLRVPLVQYRQHGSNTVGAQKHTGTLRKELSLWLSKKCRLTLKSYRIHRDLSQCFYQRFYPAANQKKINPFSDKRLDFGFSILVLGLKSLLVGYGSQGITLRLLVNKFIFDGLKVGRWLRSLRLN